MSNETQLEKRLCDKPLEGVVLKRQRYEEGFESSEDGESEVEDGEGFESSEDGESSEDEIIAKEVQDEFDNLTLFNYFKRLCLEFPKENKEAAIRCILLCKKSEDEIIPKEKDVDNLTLFNYFKRFCQQFSEENREEAIRLLLCHKFD
jgi:hypothetical protein